MDNGISGSTAGAGNEPPVFEEEFQALAEMIGFDMPEVMVDLLDTYVEESAGLVGTLLTLGRTDPGSPEVMRAARSLKSSSASIGALPLSVLCADMESHLRGLLDDLNMERQIVLIESEYERVRADLAIRRENLLNT